MNDDCNRAPVERTVRRFVGRWLEEGRWVQAYTLRGSPRRGHNARRWRTNSVMIQEYAAGVLIALLMLSGVLLPCLLIDA